MVTILCMPIKTTIIKRFYPISNEITAVGKAIMASQQSSALIARNHPIWRSMQQYKKHQEIFKKSFKETTNNRIYVAPNGIAIIAFSAIDYTYIYTNIKLKSAMERLRKGIKADFTNSQELVEVFMNKVANKEIIISDYLSNLLEYLNNLDIQEIKNSTEYMSVLKLLREYFEIFPPCIEHTKIFLKIWDKGNFDFIPLKQKFTNEKNILKTKSEDITEITSPTENKTLSLEEKKSIALNKIQNACKIMDKAFTFYEKDNILSTNEIKQWYNHIENRGRVIPLTPEEKMIINKLKKLKEDYYPSYENLLKYKKDRLEQLKKNSNLPKHLQEEDKFTTCFLPEDFEAKIKQIKDALVLLKNNEKLSINDLKLLSINSSAAVIDDEGTFKLTQKTYQALSSMSSLSLDLNFKYDKNKPEIDYIMSKIKNKDFFILSESKDHSDAIVSVAHLSHKTLVICDNNNKTKICIRLGILTSTKDENTILIDTHQVTNANIDSQNKFQMFRIISTFIIVDNNEPFNIDLEATLHFHGENSDGNRIVNILYDDFTEKQNIWSNNPYQYTYIADYNFIHKLAIIFYQNKLQQLEVEANKLDNELKTLEAEDNAEFENRMKGLKEEKNKELITKRYNRYFSLLPQEHKNLEKHLRLVENILILEQEEKNIKAKKQVLTEMAASSLLKKKEEQGKDKLKELTEKRKALQQEIASKKKEKENLFNA